VTTTEYDEMDDDFYYLCHRPACRKPAGRGHMSQLDAFRDADLHDQLHDDGVI
jgi:hypothetical protein